MTSPPMGFAADQVWMTVEDVFHIQGRGSVITGTLEGNGQLMVGDTLLCDGGNWKVDKIEQFRSELLAAEPGVKIGIMLTKGPAAGTLRGRTIQFKPKQKKKGWRR